MRIQSYFITEDATNWFSAIDLIDSIRRRPLRIFPRWCAPLDGHESRTNLISDFYPKLPWPSFFSDVC